MRWFALRFRSYGADAFFCVSSYKDLTPTEPFFDSLLDCPKRTNYEFSAHATRRAGVW
jgi:hypothetical protein